MWVEARARTRNLLNDQNTYIFKVRLRSMDTTQETREAAIDRIRKIWGSDPGRYWDELRKAKLETTEVFPEHGMKGSVTLPDFNKIEPSKKKGR